MGHSIKSTVTALLLGIAMALPDSAVKAADLTFSVVPIQKRLMTALDDTGWKVCGRYFAFAEKEEGKVIHFSVTDALARKPLAIPAYPLFDDVEVTVDDTFLQPVFLIPLDEKKMVVRIALNRRDYRTSAACLPPEAQK